MTLLMFNRVLDLNLEDHNNTLRLSLQRAIKYIEENRNPDGLWSDFLTLAGESVYWVSGCVGYALACSVENNADGQEGRSWLRNLGRKILNHQNADGGWGYGPGVPSDADSTSWCLLFLTKIRVQESESRDKALHFLLGHQSPLDGGFRTYAMPRNIGRYMMLDDSISFDGWASSHMCVTGVAVQALIHGGSLQGINQALQCIRKNQTTEGYWNPYWWSTRLYSTVNCMRGINFQNSANEKEDDDDTILNKALEWIAATQLNDGGWSGDFQTSADSEPFSTALGLSGIVMKNPRRFSERIVRAVKWLSDHQLPDGSWNSNYILRIPHPSMKEPWNQTVWKQGGRAINAVIKDHKRLYTTATVLTALAETDRILQDETK